MANHQYISIHNSITVHQKNLYKIGQIICKIGSTVISYECVKTNLSKNEGSKKYIRSGNMNISQIADKLGYDSIHHFSRQFKLRTGMTPTEYQKSVIALSDEMRVKQGGMT